ncbi:MAG: protein kinase domain-containing protein, partial [Rudaea sp.]
IGTPHYMSPEQARGRTVDGRADLYSLGIVLYELLIGRVPYSADDSLAVGIMHITQPVPLLPEHLSALQPILNRLLAKAPDDRYQNGSQLADAIEQIEIAMAGGNLPGLADPDEAYRREVPGAQQRAAQRTPTGVRNPTPPPVPASTPAPGHPTTLTPAPVLRQRFDPTMGRMDDVVSTGGYLPAARRAGKPAGAKSGSRRGWLLALPALLIILLGGGYAAWHYQDRLRALIPKTELNSLVARAHKALDEGHLIGNSGDSARELFQSARAIDPDNDQARQGLNQVGERLLDDARNALTHNDLATVHTDLAAAEEILGGGDKVEELKNALHAAETHGTEAEDLLKRAAAALSAGRLLGADSASALYRRVLDADAGNALAKDGMEKVAKAQADSVREAIAQGNADQANQRIADLAQLAPNQPAIPELRAALAQMQHSDAKAQDQQLARAEAALHDNKIAGGNGALALFQAVLKRDANNARAKAGLRKIGLALAAQASVQLDANNLPAAETALRQAEALAGDAAEVKSTRARLREMHEGAAVSGKQQQQQTTELTLAERARIEGTLGEADRALAAGTLMDPGGAYDKYRAVLNIDSNNAQALSGINHIPARARELFDKSLADRKPNGARGYLEAVAQTDPGNPNLSAMRARLATAYLDSAEAHLAQGQRDEAVRALKYARELSPSDPRNAQVEAKLQSPPPATGG